MSFVQREIDRLHNAMVADPDGEQWKELHAARQALAWALEPNGVASPADVLMGIQVRREGYPAKSRPAPFSDIFDRSGC